MNLKPFQTAILSRLAELGVRMQSIDTELGHTVSKDLEDQAIDLEDDEVLVALGYSAQAEVKLLKEALSRIEDETYGTCLSCKGPISKERLNVILHVPLCKNCVNQTKH